MSTTTEKWTIFGERLKTELERQEMSLRQFAEKAGLTLTTACRYVHSQRTPRATEILKAAKVLGVTCDYMLGLSDDPHKTRDGWSKAKARFHAEQRWIPCSERLPETEGCYITTARWKDNEPFYVCENEYGFKINEEWNGSDRIFDNGAAFVDMWGDEMDNLMEVIAWMPLPEPYSKEKK